MKLFLTLIAGAALLLAASEPWTKSPQKWSAKDAERVLTSSPWAQPANAEFAAAQDDEPPPPGPLPGAAEAGMAGSSRGATDGRWDGGVGKMPRGGVPTLPVLIRWDSALPVRDAQAQLANGTRAADSDKVVTEEQASKDYVITLIGLVPAKRYRDTGQLGGVSTSDGRVDARDPEELLEGLMASSRLMRRGRPAIAPENVRLDAPTGTIHIFFPRTNPITLRDKDVVFTTQFGSITVRKVFHTEGMTFEGQLEL